MQIEGTTTVFEPHLSRDHSERMLRYFGADISSFNGGCQRHRAGAPDRTGRGGPWGYFLCSLLPGGRTDRTGLRELLLQNVGVNPTRSGVIDILQQMGGSIELLNEREVCGEPVADLLVKSSDLQGIAIGGEVIPRAIDEFPVISVAAAFASGETTISDAKELRVKETDRIAAICDCLGGLGAAIEPRADGMKIVGGRPLSGGQVKSFGDHRIANEYGRGRTGCPKECRDP